MSAKKKWTRLLAILLVLFVMFPANLVALASTQGIEPRVIKVFYPLQFGFSQVDEDGVYSGYTYEYLIKLAQLTGWKYELVAVEQTNKNLMEGMEQVKNGEIHLMGGMMYSEAMENEYIYSAEPYGETLFTLICSEDNAELNERTLQDYRSLRVALIRGSQMQRVLDDYCQEQGLEYQPIYAKTVEECESLVNSGQADAMISKEVIETKGFKTIAKFAPQPFYLVTSKQNSELMAEIDKVMQSVNIADPALMSRLHKKYFTTPSDYNIALTVEEMEYIESAGTIPVIILTGRAPIQDYDAKTGKFSGIIIDMLEIIEEKSGLEFELIPVDTAEEVQQMVDRNPNYVVAGASYFYRSIDDFNSSSTLMTSPILTSPVVRISNVSSNARQEGVLVAQSIKGLEIDGDVKLVNGIDEIFELVSRGEYAEAYVNGYMAQYYMDTRYDDNVVVSLIPNSSYQLCIAVMRQGDLRLMGVLEQAIAAIMPSEIEDIVYQNTNYTYNPSFVDVIRKNPTPFFVTAVAVLSVILTLLLLLFIKTRSINKLVRAEKNRYKEISQMDQMTQTYNNEAFKKHVRDFLEREGEPPSGALIVCDIDNFKSINDTFGHLVGDQVISNVGELFLNIFRKEDIVGRLGGDEFMILIKGLNDPDGVRKRCQEMRQRCKTVNTECDITLSIGAAVFTGATTFEELFKKADAALYDIKNSGKDSYKIVS